MSASEGKKSFLQLIKFGLIGVSNTLIDFLIASALNALFGIYYLAKIVGYACGIGSHLVEGTKLWLCYVYLADMALVSTDLALYFHYARQNRA